MTKRPASDTENLEEADAQTEDIIFEDMSFSDKIGQGLKQFYDDVVKEKIPEEFLALLKKDDT